MSRAAEILMEEKLTTKARYLAYRWFRSQNAAASHAEGWEFASANWEQFVGPARKTLCLEDQPLALSS
jgi:hypothetical protein